MSAEHLQPRNDIEPTPEEQLLLKLGNKAYRASAEHIVDELQKGRSPSILSITRPDLLVGFATAWRSFAGDFDPVRPPHDSYKKAHFDRLFDSAAMGDPAEIEALPKFVTTLGQIGLVAELILDNQASIQDWHAGRKYIQYLGTFDPQHIGHRIAVQSSLTTEGNDSSAVIHVMEQHPRKKSFTASYDERYEISEERFYESTLLDNTRITQVDVPGGVGLAEQYPRQMELIADISGDQEHRWLTGSDKLLLDAAAVRKGVSAQKAIARFSDPKMHAYITHRKSDDRQALENEIDFVTDYFGTKVTLVNELPYDCAPASSSRVKQLRSEGRHIEANHMELYELEQ